MIGKKFLHFLVLLLVCAVLKQGHNNHRRLRNKHKVDKTIRQEQQNFHEVDALGDDFIDFGAQTGPHGQFSWHADFPLER